MIELQQALSVTSNNSNSRFRAPPCVPINQNAPRIGNVASRGEFRSNNNQVGGTGRGSKNKNYADDPFNIELMRFIWEINAQMN